MESLKSPSFDAESAMAKISTLRSDADAAYGAGNKQLGGALKSGANALEDAIETHLTQLGAPAADMLQNFRDARKLIAKTYSVEQALNQSTGNVSAKNLGKQLAKGRPLSGELETIGTMGNLFRGHNVQDLLYATPGASQLSGVASTGAAIATGNPLLLGLPYARAGFRNALLSSPVQGMVKPPSYAGNALANAMASDPARIGLQLGGILSPQFLKQN